MVIHPVGKNRKQKAKSKMDVRQRLALELLLILWEGTIQLSCYTVELFEAE
jgi:hypothetical protein